MITPAQRAEIRRLYYGERWKLGTIAAQLGLHRETVRAAVEGESVGVRRGACRPSALDPYTRPALVAIDEVGYLSYDARAADLIFQLVSPGNGN